MNSNKRAAIVAVSIALVVSIVFGGLFITRNFGKTEKEITTENAQELLNKYVREISPKEMPPVKSPVEFSEEETEAEELPDIDTCQVTAKATTPLYAEIYSSAEKAGSGTDGYLVAMAEKFNKEGFEVNGQKISVQIRKVGSGQAIDYIVTGKAVPDGYSPSNMLFVNLLEARGVDVDIATDKLVGNVAGILLDKENQEKIVATYGSVDIKAVTEATAAGEFAMGYTNPFASATGLNFLISALMRYDEANPLSAEAVQGFQNFQANVPFVSMLTMQMRTAAQNGTLNGMVMEYQSYINDANLKANYTFTPFGYRHDNPLAVISSTDPEKKEILAKFAEYCKTEEAQKIAQEYGFNLMEDYRCELPDVDGNTLVSAQRLYKENKDSGRPVVAVFVADVSGSMEGAPINSLKDSLVNSMKYISSDNYIGLVSYNSSVMVNCPIAKFDLNQQALFKGGVESLSANGGTATFDGILVGTQMLLKAKETIPDAKLMLFVLSDGETNSGYSLKDCEGILKAYDIPVYTIGYNANIDALQKISNINEAACINATTEDVIYQLKQLFQANM